jgi:hypothetical protein
VGNYITERLRDKLRDFYDADTAVRKAGEELQYRLKEYDNARLGLTDMLLQCGHTLMAATEMTTAKETMTAEEEEVVS